MPCHAMSSAVIQIDCDLIPKPWDATVTHLPVLLANRPLVLQYSSDTEDVIGIRMYRGLRTFAILDIIFSSNQCQWAVS